MPLVALALFIFGIGSWALLGGAGYLLWTWYQGDLVRDASGLLVVLRDDRRLWWGLGLLAWSLMGRHLLRLVLARGDKGPASKPERQNGGMVPGTSGAMLYVETHGPETAPPIVFTHGWGLDSTIWTYVKRDLAGSFRLILWDLPGLGKSKLAKDGALGLTDFAADLTTVMALAWPQPVILVGHSIGGMAIQTLARDNPTLFRQQVAGVVLVNTTYTNPLKTMVLSGLAQALRWPVLEPMFRLMIWLQPLAWLSAWQGYMSGSAHLANRLQFGRFVTRSQLDHTTLLGTRNPPGALAKGNLAMFRWDATEALRNLDVPLLVLGGDADLVTKLEAGQVIAQEAPRATLRTIAGVNHMGFLERADLYNSAIRDFATSLAKASGIPEVVRSA